MPSKILVVIFIWLKVLEDVAWRVRSYKLILPNQCSGLCDQMTIEATDCNIFEGQISPQADLGELVDPVIRWPLKRLIAKTIDADQTWDSFFGSKGVQKVLI